MESSVTINPIIGGTVSFYKPETHSKLWRRIGAPTLHAHSYLWPLKYHEIVFMEGLFNNILDSVGIAMNQETGAYGAKNDRTLKVLYSKILLKAQYVDRDTGVVFVKNIPTEILKISSGIINSALQGLRHNPFLRHVGGSYQKMKFRQEKIKARGRSNSDEEDRTDLLYDASIVIISGFVNEYLCSELGHLMKKMNKK